MNAKGMNLLEAHVEKIVLAVAAAGALYLGYLAMQPVIIAPGSTVTVDKVEESLTEDIEKLKDSERHNAELGPIKSTIPDSVTEYRKLIQLQPLPTSLVNPSVPLIGPLNPSVHPESAAQDLTFSVVTPTPVPPESLTAEAWQQPVAAVALPAPGGNVAPPAAGASLPMRDQNAVVIYGNIPIGKMQAEMAAQKGTARLPDNLQRASVFRIEVQRRVLSVAGWSDWKDVPAAKGSVAPTAIDWASVSDVAPELDLVDSEFKQIVIPNFYLDAQGVSILPPNLTKPTSKSFFEVLKQLQDAINKAKNITVAPPPAAPAGAAPAPASGDSAAAAVPPVTDPAVLRAQPLIPFAFWDEGVESDHQYQYQVRVVYVNPTFNWQFGLKNPKMKAQPTLASAWVPITIPVVVNADIAFFIGGAGERGGAKTVDVRLYKRTAGKWYRTNFDTEIGMPITGSVPLVDVKPEIKLDVDTGYTVIDVVGSGNDARAVLMDPLGNLVTRDTAEDRGKPENIKLFALSVVRTPTAPPPTTPTRGGTGGTPPPPRRGSGTPPPQPPGPPAPDAGGGFNG